MKAFLSHSSTDKEIVTTVAKHLGRQFCVFDTQVFQNGVEFRKSILDGLEDSKVFVLFASRKALDSIWVDHEIDGAWYLKLRRKLDTALVYLIDAKVRLDDLPEWLRRSKVVHEISPQIIARDIKHHLDDLLRERHQPYFVGRTSESQSIENVLLPIDGSSPPHALVVWGLPGIGRRTIIRQRVGGPMLSLHKSVETRIGDGSNIRDICKMIAERVEPWHSHDQLAQILRSIENLDDQAALARTIENLRKIVRSGELPILVDDGGLLDSNGFFTTPVMSLIKELQPHDDAYLCIVSSRHPQNDFSELPPTVHIPELPKQECMRLISLLAQKEGIAIARNQIEELAAFMAGYPPGAYFAIEQAKKYGLDLVLKRKNSFVQFRNAAFLRYLAEQVFTPDEKRIIRLLAQHSPLPIGVIHETLRIELDSLADALVRLIDLSLIVFSDRGTYRIADPVASAATGAFGFLHTDEHLSVTRALEKYLSMADTDTLSLDLFRVFFRAATMGGDRATAKRSFHLANDLVQLTEDFYHDGRYSEAIDTGLLAIDQRPTSEKARRYLIQALVQEERWEEADEQLEMLRPAVKLRDYFYLVGFRNRLSSRIPEAIEAYSESQRLGRRDVAIRRELAHCYFLIGELELANDNVIEALRLSPDNAYLLDMQVKIATRLGDRTAVDEALDKLEFADPEFYFHRKSCVELSFGNLDLAEKASEAAMRLVGSPRFQVFYQLARCKIELGKLTEAEEILKEMDTIFKKREDRRLYLHARLRLKQGRIGEAHEFSMGFRDKLSPEYRSIRWEVLRKELDGSALPSDLRSNYESELADLERQLSHNTDDDYLD